MRVDWVVFVRLGSWVRSGTRHATPRHATAFWCRLRSESSLPRCRHTPRLPLLPSKPHPPPPCLAPHQPAYRAREHGEAPPWPPPPPPRCCYARSPRALRRSPLLVPSQRPPRPSGRPPSRQRPLRSRPQLPRPCLPPPPPAPARRRARSRASWWQTTCVHGALCAAATASTSLSGSAGARPRAAGSWREGAGCRAPAPALWPSPNPMLACPSPPLAAVALPDLPRRLQRRDVRAE
jgi:hypothetical protein